MGWEGDEQFCPEGGVVGSLRFPKLSNLAESSPELRVPVKWATLSRLPVSLPCRSSGRRVSLPVPSSANTQGPADARHPVKNSGRKGCPSFLVLSAKINRSSHSLWARQREFPQTAVLHRLPASEAASPQSLSTSFPPCVEAHKTLSADSLSQRHTASLVGPDWLGNEKSASR